MASTSSIEADGFQPKIVYIKRKPNQGFGFTLRHFIAYPPESWDSSDLYQGKAMETIFIKEVHLNGPAHLAGLQTGDRILTVNDEPVAGIPYSVIVQRIKQTPILLKLEVVSKECDVLQMYYTDIAHNPESNRYRDANKFALLNYLPSGSGSSNNSSCSNINNTNNTISRKTLSFPTTTPINHMISKFSTNNCHLETRNSNLKFNDKFSSIGASNFNFSSLPSTTASTLNNTCDFMARLRKSIEQKEEFLKAVAPQNYSSSLFKTFKSSDNPKRIISGDKVNFYALNSMGYSDNPKGGQDDDDDNKQFALVGISGSGGVEGTSAQASLSAAVTLSPVTTGGTSKDIHNNDEQSLYSSSKKDVKLSKTIERYKPVSPLTLGIPATESLSLIKIPSVFDKHIQNKEQNHERKIDMKSVNVQNKITTKAGAIGSILEHNSNIEQKENELDCITTIQKSSQILRRFKTSNNTNDDNNKLMRRISYLRATNNEDCYQNLETTNTELMNLDIKSMKACDKEKDNECKTFDDLKSNENDEIISSDMEIKSSSIFGKRLTEYRSWRHVKVELKGDTLKIFTGRNINKIDTNVIELNLKNYEIFEDVTSRRKYVFKLQSLMNAQKSVSCAGVLDELQQQQQQQQIKNDCSSNSSSSTVSSVQFTEIYFKTENSNEMKKWIELIKSRTRRNSKDNEQGKQLAEPQKTAAISSVSTSEYSYGGNTDFKSTTTTTTTISSKYSDVNNTTAISSPATETKQQQQQNDNETESSSNSVCSPVIKTRKSEKSDKDLGSPKSKNWRGLLFRKGGSGGGSSSGSSSGGGGGSSGNSTTQSGSANSRAPIGSIGVPLKLCPMSKDNEYVPCIVDVCTKIVESKGLNVVGIYRIPGNKAAISELKNQVNRIDFTWDKINDDVRWDDVNVVSSLLKLFIRSLPDGLLPSTFYNNFIEADKGEKKLKEIKYLLNQLPVHSYETLKHIIRHLHRISKNCDVNLMEPKNLAIVFGPSIIRTPNETLETAVKDMKHQCCIVELLLSQYEYFFECGAFPQLEDNSTSITSSVIQQQQEKQQQTLLLGNVQKIEKKYNDKESVAARFIPHLRRRSQSKRSTINSDTYSGESILSLEYKKSNNDQGENSEHGSKEEGGSLEISISLTDEDSSNSRISDSGSMSLTTITDTLDSKLRNLRSTSESQSDENDSPNKQQQKMIRRNNASSNVQQQQQQQPLILHENIPFADESPERPHSSSTVSDNSLSLHRNARNLFTRTNQQQHQQITTTTSTTVATATTATTTNIQTTTTATMNLSSTSTSTSNNHSNSNNNNNNNSNSSSSAGTNNNNNNNANRDAFNKNNTKLISSTTSSSKHHHHHLHHQLRGGGNKSSSGGGLSCNSDNDDSDSSNNDDDDDDSEVSTTSDPKESILISPLFLERYKKRSGKNGTNGTYNKLFRSASFNCRNYSSINNKYNCGNNTISEISGGGVAGITTNLNITSINLTKDEKTDMNYTKKRQIQNKQNRSIKRRHTVGGPSDYSATITRRSTDAEHVLEVGIRIKNVNRRN